MGYYKVELIDGKVYDFDKKCTSFILNKDGYTVFMSAKMFLMYVNKKEVKKIEWVDDSEEVEILSNQESKIEWITDRNPTVEECEESGNNRFLVTTHGISAMKSIKTSRLNSVGGWVDISRWESVIAWAKVEPYKK